MAAVEKRKNGWTALIINRLMFMVICLFIVFPLSGIPQKIFGVIFTLLYYRGVHDYCFKSGREHSQPYIKENPSWKFPLYYGFIGNVYFWIPILVLLIGGKFVPAGGVTFALRFFYIAVDSPFIYLDIFKSTEYSALNVWQPALFSALYFVSAFVGYFMGAKGSSVKLFFRKIIDKMKSGKEE